ncbi:MAG: hypothetical protein CVV44_09065 [Spirochaetae bacterium HGW-Spirochaetae-1]|nr:MAG: hypothetical protein CVV44_09065 [Spirochaetae bacterium HGW-Spirochaetae-1]
MGSLQSFYREELFPPCLQGRIHTSSIGYSAKKATKKAESTSNISRMNRFNKKNCLFLPKIK